ncbi:MAG: hypothetical protein ACJ74O_19320 [Frankiaceae bacterium]
MDLVLDGSIAGFGTASGHRFVIGRWTTSPYGPLADVMHEDPAGHRTLLAPTAELAELAAATYRFDEVRVVPVEAAGAGVVAGELVLRIVVGRRTAVGWLLRAVPRPLAHSLAWVGLLDRVAGVLLPGVRTRGSAGQGREEWYAATDNRRIVAATASLGGEDLGALADVDPPVRFGFGSVPRRPSWTRVRTTVRVSSPA